MGKDRKASGKDDIHVVHIQEAHGKMMQTLELDHVMPLGNLGFRFYKRTISRKRRVYSSKEKA